jgi:AcrR family transcriptional regulator
MARHSTPQTRLADAALRLAAKKAWNEISLLDVAKAAKVPTSELQMLARTKSALIGFVLERVGAAAAQRYKPTRGPSTARERLFDVVMAWFDALSAHRPAVRSFYRGLGDPFTLFAARGDFIAAAEWLMALAQADRGSLPRLRAAGLALILARALAVWLDDDADMTKTMARLDGDLMRGEDLFGQT